LKIVVGGVENPRNVLRFIIKIKSNTTNNDLPWRFGLYQRPSSKETDRDRNVKVNRCWLCLI